MSNWIKKFLKDFSDENIVTISRAMKFKNRYLPNLLYKYRSVDEKSLSSLIGNYVWCTTLENYNDPYEGYIRLNNNVIKEKIISNQLTSYNLTDNMHLKTKSQLLDSIVKNIDDNVVNIHKTDYQNAIKICSFSANLNNRLMWAHYANCHKGFCLEYDVSSVKNDIYPVIYNKEIYDATRHYILSLDDKEKYKTFKYLVAMSKDECWQYENEYRIIIEADEENKYPLKPNAIYIGAQASEDIRKSLVNIAHDKQIKAYKMNMSFDEYKLISSKIL